MPLSLRQFFFYQVRLPVCLSSLLLFAFIAGTATATTYSIASKEEIPIHSGQGTEHKILALLKDKEIVTSVEESGSWVRVSTANGLEGWVLKRHLASHPSPDEVFALPTVNLSERPHAAASPPPEQNNGTPQKNADQGTPPALPTKEGGLAREENDATYVLPLPGLTESELSVKELQDELARLMNENKELRQNEKIQWFLAGGGVFVFGWLIGLITCRSKRRKPSLL